MKLTKIKVSWDSIRECEDAVQKEMSKISQPPILTSHNFSKGLIVQVDNYRTILELPFFKITKPSNMRLVR